MSVAPEGDRPLRVLFVCTSNICRSAFAERMARHLLRGDPSVEVLSADTHRWIDEPVDSALAA
jgi:protein-tyrosine-phosphatase